MSADAAILLVVISIMAATIWQRISGQIVILVLMSSFLVSMSFGADLINFLQNHSEIFDIKNVRLLIYLLLVGVPTVLTYLHLRGVANNSVTEKFIVSVFLSLLLLVVIRSLFEVAGLENPLRNSFFANQINEYEGLIIFTAFSVALFEVLNHNNSLGIRAKRGRRKTFARKK